MPLLVYEFNKPKLKEAPAQTVGEAGTMVLGEGAPVQGFCERA
jgi:hypothetical protein